MSGFRVERVLDIHRCTINRFDPATGRNIAWPLPSMPGSFALRVGNGAVIAARDGILDIDFASGQVRRLVSAPFDPAHYRFNDGKPDRQGRFWAGSFPMAMTIESRLDDAAILYRYDGVALVAGIDPITAANGTAFSADGRTMYRAESLDGVVLAYDYDTITGTPSNERVFARVPFEQGVLDGATVDTQGGYWVALPYGAETGGVGRFAPDGSLDIYIPLPVRVPTMVAFGGPRLSTLYITSLSDPHFTHGFDAGAMAGDIFAVETPFRGVAETLFPYCR